jgi:hypothetical protein
VSEASRAQWYGYAAAIGLRDVLCRGEVSGSDPDEDLLGDFDGNRDVRYAAIGESLDVTEFTIDLRPASEKELDRLDTAVAQWY